MRSSQLCLALVLQLTAAAAVEGQAVERSRIVVVRIGVQDRVSDAPVANAVIRATALPSEVTTDTNGRVRVELPVGSATVLVRALGYSAADTTMALVSDTSLDVRMDRASVHLEPVRVTSSTTSAHLREFEMRRQLGNGRYLVESDIAVELNRPFASVAATRFPGLKQVRDAEGQVRLASTRGSCGYQEPLARSRGLSGCASPKPCLVQMYLDDIRLSEDDFDVIKTEQLAAIEYYTGATVPVKYRIGGSACGVMLVWTKR
jgi:hypothetical protein